MPLYPFLNLCILAPKALGKEELGELPYFSLHRTFNQILRHLVPALGLCPVLLLQSWSWCIVRMEPHSAVSAERGSLCHRFHITQLIVRHQPTELEILG